jgi:hypothetical protein
MDNKELKGLSEAYNEVYLDEALPAPGRSRGAVTMYSKPIANSATDTVSRFPRKGPNWNYAEKGPNMDFAAMAKTAANKNRNQDASVYNRYSSIQGRRELRKVGRIPTREGTGMGGPSDINRPAAPTPKPTAPAPQPVQSTRTPRPSTGLSTPASTSRPVVASSPRPVVPSSLSTGGRRSNSELEGKTFVTRATSGGTKYEVRTPTSAELAAARNAGGGEKGVQAAVARSSNLMSGPTATPIAAAVRPATPTPQKRNQAPSRTPIPEMNSYDFGKPDRITQDVASLYQSIYEAKKKVDQDQDGDNDFADVEIARMVAGGMPLKDAIAAVRNKSYNKKAELGEAAVRVPKKVRGAKDAKAYMAGRSDAGKRISGDEDTGPRYYTLGRSRGATPDSPTEPGQRPQHTPRATKSELEYARYVRNSSKKNPNLFGGPKGLPEEFELWVNELLDEGYDLSEYTVDEIYEIFEETEKKLRPASERTKTAKTRAQITSQRAKERAAEKKAEALERAAQKVINQTQGRSGRVSEKPMGSEAPAAKEAAPNREDVTTQIEPGEAGSKKHQRAHRALKAAQANEEFEFWVNDLLDEGYDLSDYTWDELYENYQQLTESPYQIFGPDPKGPSDSKEIKLGKPYNDRKSARSRADKLDQEIGGYRHSVRKITNESYDAYNLVIGHLLDEGFADDCDSANMMIERMSDEWLNEILESKN